MSLSTLMYHAVLDSLKEPQGSDPWYAVTENTFRLHLQKMREIGWSGTSVKDRLIVGDGDDRCVAITFDDGHVSNYTAAFSALLEAGWHADFFVNPTTIGTNHFMSWENLREMAQHGMSIQSHGQTHRYFDELDDDAIRDELDRSKGEIEERVGQPVELFAPPGGRMTERVSAIAQELGYRAICGSRPGRWDARSLYVPRCAVLASTPLPRFEKWVRGDRLDFFLQSCRFETMHLLKKTLGNHRYERIRARLLGQSDDGM